MSEIIIWQGKSQKARLSRNFSFILKFLELMKTDSWERSQQANLYTGGKPKEDIIFLLAWILLVLSSIMSGLSSLVAIKSCQWGIKKQKLKKLSIEQSWSRELVKKRWTILNNSQCLAKSEQKFALGLAFLLNCIKNTKPWMMRSLLSIQTGAETRKKIFHGRDGASNKVRFLFCIFWKNAD